jgi:tetratricopeptide (TPR) repeat protein
MLRSRRFVTRMQWLRRQCLTCGLLGIAVSVPAIAQQPPANYPAPCDGAQVSNADVNRAHAVFLSGKQFLEESNYDKALGYFEDAYAIDCSVHAILPIIATAYERKGDKGEAIRALEEYLRRAPNAPDRSVVERRIKNLKDLLAHEQEATAPASSPTSTATIASLVSAPPAASTATSSSLASAGSPVTESIRVPAHDSHHTVWPWVLVGAGGAAVLVAAPILYGVGHGEIASALAKCDGKRSCPPSAPAGAISEGNDGRALEGWAFAVGGAGLAVSAAGLIWHFLEKEHANTAAAWMSPVVSPGYTGVGMAGTF